MPVGVAGASERVVDLVHAEHGRTRQARGADRRGRASRSATRSPGRRQEARAPQDPLGRVRVGPSSVISRYRPGVMRSSTRRESTSDASGLPGRLGPWRRTGSCSSRRRSSAASRRSTAAGSSSPVGASATSSVARRSCCSRPRAARPARSAPGRCSRSSEGDAYVFAASYGGHDEHPRWYLNLEADPDVRSGTASATVAGRARITSGTERAAVPEVRRVVRHLRRLREGDRARDPGRRRRARSDRAAQ